ncbi:SLBB domain-containing protein [Terriglobus roseus]|uniref:SLBB domain-containing protein n=1 Tax=Terriglobus roseus TaxID=392734 RepID=UPI0012EAE25D|nr:SLBB domain-containing protein [Terriglobus roseus]
MQAPSQIDRDLSVSLAAERPGARRQTTDRPQSAVQQQRLALLNAICDPAKNMGTLLTWEPRRWKQHLRWLDVGGIALSLHDAMAQQGAETFLPAEIQSRWQRNLRDNVQRMKELATESCAIHSAFQRGHVCYATLKGFSLVPLSVPRMELRSQIDLDFLVAEDDILQAKQLLEVRGYHLRAVSGRSWEFKANESAVLGWRDQYQPIAARIVELHVEARDAAHPLLPRIRWERFQDVDMPVLHPADLYLGQGLHLFKHIHSEFFRVAHLLEFRRHTVAREHERNFFDDVRHAADDHPRAVQGLAVAIAVAESATGSFAPNALRSWTTDQMSSGVRRWVQEYGARAAAATFPGSKNYLLLQRELEAASVTSRRTVRQSLLPRALPPVIIAPREQEPLRETYLRYRLQIWFLFFRARFHLVEGLHYLYESWRWNRGSSFLLAIALLMFCGSARGQQQQQRDESPLLYGPPSATQDVQTTNPSSQPRLTTDIPTGSQYPPDTTALTSRDSSSSATAIISFLQSTPDALIEVKQLMSDFAGQQGQPISPDSITDEQLYSRIATNADFRRNVGTFLQTRGFTVDTIEESEDTSVPPSRQSELSSREIPNRTVQRPVPLKKDTPEPSKEPRVLNRPTPYNLRSLHDLYTQVTDSNGPLKRFGSDVFLRRDLATARAMGAPATASLPADDNYVLGPGDSVSIQMWGSITQTLTRTVDRDGNLGLQDAGQAHVAGMSLRQAQETVANLMRPQFRDVRVSLSLGKLRSVRVYVVGDVQRPGAYELSAQSTVISALYAAGGPTAVGSLRVLRHYRGTLLLGEIDLYDFLLHGTQSEDRLQSGDTLLVPPAGPQVAVSGAVKRPAIYELKGKTTLSSLLEDAGSATVTAELSHLTVERVRANMQRETIDLALNEGSSSDQTRAAIEHFLVQDGDAVHVIPIEAYSQRVVYREGHVLHPGRVAWHDGMRLHDVLPSYRDMLPEPADRGEIIRLVPPDLHVETIEFNVADAMIGNDNPALQPLDTIRVQGRYDADAPKVSIDGEVLRPGTYPFSQGMTAAQLVRMAGGFTRGALLTSADLSSYTMVGATRVQDEQTSLRIGDAVLRNDAGADVSLKPGDTLNVHRLTGWDDIGASIELVGEVAHPGSYGFRQGERLSSILRRAGGFLETSYSDGAVMTRPDVQVLEEKSRQELIRQIETSASAARTSSNVTPADGAAQLQLVQAQQDQILANLKSQPATGRLVLHISNNISEWENTPADIEVRKGDKLMIPKRPGFVLISGQVYNSSAIAFAPGKSAGWYLHRAGGTTQVANTKEIFVIRANGSVVGRNSGGGLFHDGVLETKLNPGDVVVVPQKIIGASLFWRNLLTVAQITSSIAITAAVAGVL